LELHFDRKTSAWAKDRIWHASQKAMVDSKGCLTLTLRVADTPELEGWILSFGAGVRVLRPASLRERVTSTALQIAAQK
jgi:predicted DNA-binding transcriptional regulator YafY